MMQAEIVVEEAQKFDAAKAAALPLCRSCGSKLGKAVLDLGMQPLSNAYLRADQLSQREPFYPLRIRLCSECALVQVDAVIDREVIFHSGYQYYSSYSDSWLAHAKAYAERMCEERKLNANSFIVEIASNDGYLLRWFTEHGLRVRGIDPAQDCANAAEKLGIPTTIAFFGLATASAMVRDYGKASLLIGNNILAHVPDLNDFVAGVAVLLATDGIATFEFPHLLELMRLGAYDTIYHEHYSYLDLLALMPLFARHGLKITNVERLSTHGGSLRILVEHAGRHEPSKIVAHMLVEEYQAGLNTPMAYHGLSETIERNRLILHEMLILARREGKSVAAYGAAAKGNTFLNTLGIRSDFIDFVVDRNPQKVGSFLPGSHIPIVDVVMLEMKKPDIIFVLPWNLSDEIARQIEYVNDWNARLYRCIPEIQELS